MSDPGKRNRAVLTSSSSSDSSPIVKRAFKDTDMADKAVTLADLKQMQNNIRQDFKMDLQSELRPLVKQVSAIENSIEKLAREKNVVIHGLPESPKETPTQLMKEIEVLFVKLGMSDPLIDNVYRLSKPVGGKVRPVMLKFVSTMEKRLMMTNRRNVITEKIFISDDMSKQQQQDQKLLRAKIKELKLTNKDIICIIRESSMVVKLNESIINKFT